VLKDDEMAELREIGIRVALDQSEVTLEAPAGCTRDAAAPATLASRMRGLGLLVDPAVESALAQFSLDYAAGGHPLQRVVLRAIPAVKGARGRIDWAPGFEPDRAVTIEGAGTDHYTGRTYARIAAGTHLGLLVQPGDGTPGRDVRGAEIDGRGESIISRLDSSIRSDADGNLSAGKDGMLIGLGGMYRIADVLEISQSVDFNTGHITAAGDVIVHEGVRPGFKVSAAGTLKIHGLVETADIASQGDLSLTIGMAGAGRGTINAGTNARVGYLDSVTATIEGTLIVERELVNSNVTIGGSLDARDATVFGGEIAVTDSCRIKTLGSEAFRATHIMLGDVPLLARQSLETVRALKALDTKLAQLAEKERIIRLNPRLRPVDREQLTEIAFEVQELQTERTEKMGNAGELQSAVQARRKLDVEVSKAIFPNVKLTIGQFVVTFDRPVRGLIRIFWDPSGKLLCRLGTAEPQPLDTIAKVARTADASPPSRAKAA
jgi:hypothetical protein